MIGNIDKFHPYFDIMCCFLERLLDELPFSKTFNDAVENSFSEAGLSDSQFTIMFPNQSNDILNSLVDYLNLKTTQHADSLKSSGVKGVKALLKELIMFQIRLKPHMPESFRKISTYSTCSLQITGSLKRHFSVIDNLWYCANDTSTDFNYWSKRGLLGKIYMDSLLYALSDKSYNYKDTEKFLIESFDKIHLIEKVKPYLPNLDKIEEKIAITLAKIRYKK